MSATLDAAAPPLLRRTFRRARFWLVLLAVAAIGVAIVIASTSSGRGPLDPDSAAHNGSQALAVLLNGRGTGISKLSSPDDAIALPSSASVLVVEPDDLGSDQLRQLAARHRLILVDPDVAALAAVTSSYERDDIVDAGPIDPGCTWPGAQAAGPVTFPDGTDTYTGPSTCYEGAVVVSDSLVVLGSPDLLRNDQLAKNNIAALDLNSISNDGAVQQVAWLLPGIGDTGSGSASVWDLFPTWAQRAFWWLLVVGVLVALWRGRRLGPVVVEPLPVIVRSAEVVEGHGRLYRRAQARERAAGLLRAASVTRLAARLGLDRHAPAGAVAAVLSAQRGPDAGAALVGGVPSDDDALVRLADDLDALEAGSVPSVPSVPFSVQEVDR